MNQSKKQNPCQANFPCDLAKLKDFDAKSMIFARPRRKVVWHGFCFLEWVILRQTIAPLILATKLDEPERLLKDVARFEE